MRMRKNVKQKYILVSLYPEIFDYQLSQRLISDETSFTSSRLVGIIFFQQTFLNICYPYFHFGNFKLSVGGYVFEKKKSSALKKKQRIYRGGVFSSFHI